MIHSSSHSLLLRSVVSFSVLLFFVMPLRGELLVYEPFDYATPTLADNDGGIGWDGPWGSVLTATEVSGMSTASINPESIDFPGYRFSTEGGSLVGPGTGETPTFSYRKLAEPIDGTTDTTVYITLLMGRGEAETGSRLVQIRLFREGTTLQTPRFGSLSSTQSEFALGAVNHRPADTFLYDTTYFVVAKYVFKSDLSADAEGYYRLFAPGDIIPANEEDIEWTSTITNSMTATGMNLRYDRLAIVHGADIDSYFDELRIATTWQDAVHPGLIGRTYAEWRADRIGPDAPDEVASPKADADGDGVQNLVEYLLHGNPLTPNRKILPTEEIVEINGEKYLALRFRPDEEAMEATYAVIVSSDPAGPWEELPLETQRSMEGEWIIVRDIQPMSDVTRRFLRLRVTLLDN